MVACTLLVQLTAHNRGGCKIYGGGEPKLGVTNVYGNLKLAFVPDSKNHSLKVLLSLSIVIQRSRSVQVKNLTGSATCFLGESPVSVSVDNVKGVLLVEFNGISITNVQ